MDIALIIDRLVPQAQFTQSHTLDDLQRTWTDARPIPPIKKIKAEWAVYQQEKEANKYAEDRRKEYPSLEDQVASLMKRASGDTADYDALQIRINAVKTKHPKPLKRA